MNNPYAAPKAPIATGTAVPTTLTETLFSFQGRARRSTYWKVSLGAGAVYVAIVFAIGLVAAALGGGGSKPPVVLQIIAGVLYIPLIWIGLAVSVRRWHDRNKSGFWVFINLIPIIGGIWSFIETGCLEGSQGANQYGPDPKGAR